MSAKFLKNSCVQGIILKVQRPEEGAPVAHYVKRQLTDLADRVRSSLEAKSSQS